MIQLNVNLYRNPCGILFWCTLGQYFSVWWLHAGILMCPEEVLNHSLSSLLCKSWFAMFQILIFKPQWGMVLLYHWLLQLKIDKLCDLWPSDVCYICRHQFLYVRHMPLGDLTSDLIGFIHHGWTMDQTSSRMEDLSHPSGFSLLNLLSELSAVLFSSGAWVIQGRFLSNQ